VPRPAALVKALMLSDKCPDSYGGELRWIITAIVDRMYYEKTEAAMSFTDISRRTGYSRWTIGRHLHALQQTKRPILRMRRQGRRDEYTFEINTSVLPQPEQPPREQTADGPATAAWILEHWNRAAREHGMREAVGWTTTRRHNVRRELTQQPTRSYWCTVIDRIVASGYCTGKIAGRDGQFFRADFDFLINADKRTRVLEGKYDNENFERHDGRRHGRARWYSDPGVIKPIKMISGDHGGH
jgi:hypothetical protein